MSNVTVPPPAASTRRFVVVRFGKGWIVKDGVDKHGPYLSRRDALSDALDAARAASAEGETVEVVDGSGAPRGVVLWRTGDPGSGTA